jgi:hypothetical protein
MFATTGRNDFVEACQRLVLALKEGVTGVEVLDYLKK